MLQHMLQTPGGMNLEVAFRYFTAFTVGSSQAFDYCIYSSAGPLLNTSHAFSSFIDLAYKKCMIILFFIFSVLVTNL